MTRISGRLPVAAFGTIVGMMAGIGAACAQAPIPGQNVADRVHPEYAPVTIPVGAFTLAPTAGVRLEATDNFRASNDNRQSDVYVTVRPAATLRSNWSRHQLSADAFYERRIHFNLTDENASSLGGSVRGLYDISRDTQLSAEIFAQDGVESRSALGSFRDSPEPVQFTILRASLGISQAFNDLTLSSRGSIEKLNFRDARLNGGGRIDQDFRDFERVALSGNANYRLRNGIGLVGGLQYDRTEYSFGPGSAGFVPGTTIDRASSGISAQAGLSFELTQLIFGTIQAGYLTRRYDDPRLRDTSGLTYSANVLWNPTPITSVNLRAGRNIEESASSDFAGNIRSDFSLRVDHELYRYILLSGDVSYSRFRANGPGPRGTESGAGVSARYLIDRRFSLNAGLRHARRSSNFAGLRYTATSGSVGVLVAF